MAADSQSVPNVLESKREKVNVSLTESMLVFNVSVWYLVTGLWQIETSWFELYEQPGQLLVRQKDK